MPRTSCLAADGELSEDVCDGGAVEVIAVKRLVAARQPAATVSRRQRQPSLASLAVSRPGAASPDGLASWAVDPSDQSIFPFRRATQNQVHPAAAPQSAHLLARHLDGAAWGGDDRGLGAVTDRCALWHVPGSVARPSASGWSASNP